MAERYFVTEVGPYWDVQDHEQPHHRVRSFSAHEKEGAEAFAKFLNNSLPDGDSKLDGDADEG